MTTSTTRGRRAAGYSLVELLIAMVLTLVILSAVLLLFQMHSKIARVETQVADLQQNQRFAQYDIIRNLRMAGRGGMPGGLPNKQLPLGAALELQNNVVAGTRIGGVGTPLVVPNTDILTVRGILTNAVYQIEPSDVAIDIAGRSGTVSVNYLSPGGLPQDLVAIEKHLDNITGGGRPEALLLVSPLGDQLFSPVQWTGGTVDTGQNLDSETIPVRATLSFTWGASPTADEYLKFTQTGSFPNQMTTAAYLGIFEEYRYYIRQAPTVPGNPASPVVPRLSRARFYPGTDVIHPSNPTAAEDLADNVLDLQLALGIDRDGDGLVTEGVPDDESDEWLFNASGDSPPDLTVWNGPRPRYVRVTTLVRTDRPDQAYTSPAIDWLEDHQYAEPAVPTPADRPNRVFRRRQMQTVVSLRNL